MLHWLRSKSISWRWVIALCLLMLAGVLALSVSMRRREAEANAAEIELNAKLYRQSRQEEALNQQKEDFGSKAYVEQVARSSGFMKEGEIHFEITNPEALAYYTEEENQMIAEDLVLEDALRNTEQLIKGK